MIATFFTIVSLVLMYLIVFISYFILYVEEIFLDPASLMSVPLRSEMLVIKNIGPSLILLLMPVFLTLMGLAFFLFSLNRWRGKNNNLIHNEIKEPSICVALTAYDDAEPIFEAVKDFRLQEFVKKVIVIDNNSKDHTEKYASEAGAITVKEKRQGYGWACIRGLEEALKITDINIIALCEGDRTFRAYDLKKMVPYLDNAEMVVGTRTTQELLAQKSQLDWFYIGGNLLLAKMIQIKFWDVKHWGRVRLTDVGCTFRVIRREALEKIIDNLKVGGDHFSPHMIMVALEKRIKVVEVPITFRERVGKSKGAGSNKINAIKVGLKMLWHIISY